MNIDLQDHIITLYHHNTQICLDQVRQLGYTYQVVDFKQNIFCINFSEEYHYFTIKDGKILKLLVNSCRCEKTLFTPSLYMIQKCYKIVDDTIIIYSIDHEEEFKLKPDLEHGETLYHFTIIDDWYVVYTTINDKKCTRLYAGEKCYKFKFWIDDIVDGLILCDKRRLINIKKFMKNDVWIEYPDSYLFIVKNFMYLFKDGYFMAWNNGHVNSYRVVNDTVIEVERFCGFPKLSFSDDYLTKLTDIIKNSTGVIDAIVKNVILHYFGI